MDIMKIKTLLCCTLCFFLFSGGMIVRPYIPVVETNTDYTQDPDLVLYMNMDVDEDPISDNSANSNTGALEAAGQPNYVVGKYIGGYDFAGVDQSTTADYVVVSDDATLDITTTGITVMCWVNVDALVYRISTPRAFNHIISKWESYVLRLNDQSIADGAPADQYGWAFTIWDGSTAYTVDESNNSGDKSLPTLDTWIHVAATYDGTTLKIYENGVLLNTAARSGDIDSNAKDLYLGDYESGFDGTQLDGSLDEVAIFKRDLTIDEIQEIYANGMDGMPAAFELQDFTTYTESDTGSYLTVTETKVQSTSEPRTSTSIVYKDFGADYFGDFVHKFTMECEAADNNSNCGRWMVCNNTDAGSTTPYIKVQYYKNSASPYNLELQLQDSDETESYISSIGTTYYITVSRSSGTVSCVVYSDEARTSVLHTFTNQTEATAFQYLRASFSRNGTGAEDMTSYTENLYIST